MINFTDKFETIKGVPVTIVPMTIRGSYPFIVIEHCPAEDYLYRVTENGVLLEGDPIIRKVNPYKDWKIDDKILCYDSEGKVYNRHYAGLNSFGQHVAYTDGGTSWSTAGVSTWSRMERVEDQ